MDATDIAGSQKDSKPPKPMPLVLGALIVSFVVSFIVISLRKYGGFNYFGHTTVLSNAVVEAVGAAFVLPLIHLAIASLWKTKRNSRSRRNVFFGWGVAVGIMQLLNVVQIYNLKGTPDAHVTSAGRAKIHAPQEEIEEMASVRKPAEQHEARPAYSHVITIADPNQSMEGTYCDRLAAVGKSLVNGRDKGTQRATIEAAITNTAEITESERVMYRQMTQVVYDDSSLTEAVMYERTHKACKDTGAELAEVAADQGRARIVTTQLPSNEQSWVTERCQSVAETAAMFVYARDEGRAKESVLQFVDNAMFSPGSAQLLRQAANHVYASSRPTSRVASEAAFSACVDVSTGIYSD